MSATLGHYHILEKIGAGGMGEVFRAHDEHLDREVAIKVLTPGTLGDESAHKRFRQEALALSKLNHPNIATVHDFDSHTGRDFLVTEYIPGRTLEAMLGSPLLERDIIHLGEQMAEGLAAAHDQGIVHRDLKPSNLRVTPDGRLKILDFGLAKTLRKPSPTEETQSLSQTEGAVGTLPYMAPEQLLNDKVDARTDIWAVGCVLYEMATGRRPFLGAGPALTDGILHQPPAPPSKASHKVSPGLEAIILKCLEKDPSLRYASARDIAVDLHRLGTGAVTKALAAGRRWFALKLAVAAVVTITMGMAAWLVHRRSTSEASAIRSIAVLPLANLSGDPQQEYFADGVTEELITYLGKVSALRVISRTSVMQFKQTKKTVPTIAQELNVDAVIEGSVLRSGNRVRVTAQLIQAKAERHLWAESYERDLTDILTLQSEVARAIANEIKIRVTPEEQIHLASARPVNPEAFDAYLKAKSYVEMSWGRGLPETKKAIEHIQHAIDLDPTYAPGYVLLTQCYFSAAWNGLAPPREILPLARGALDRALGLDPMLAEGHAWLGNVKSMFDWDWSGAEQEHKHALVLNPNSAVAHSAYSSFLMYVGRFDESVRESQKALELDPLSRVTSFEAGWALYFARRHDESIAQFKKVLEVTPDFAYAEVSLATNYAQKGTYRDAVAACQRAATVMPEDQNVLGVCGMVYALVGERQAALTFLEQLKKLERRR